MDKESAGIENDSEPEQESHSFECQEQICYQNFPEKCISTVASMFLSFSSIHLDGTVIKKLNSKELPTKQKRTLDFILVMPLIWDFS